MSGDDLASSVLTSASALEAIREPGADVREALAPCVEQLGLKEYERHVFLCADQTKPKCCDKAVGLEAWDYLKKRLKALGLDAPSELPMIFRTKANCLRVCQRGPILLVYPDRIWYHSATPPVIERIIQEHLLNSQVVEEYMFVLGRD